MYPHCLYFLDLVQDEKFRNECKRREFTDYIAKQQGLHWQYYRKNRMIASSQELMNKTNENVENKSNG